MSETQSTYWVSGLSIGPRKELLLQFSNPNYEFPTSEDVKALVKQFNLTGGSVATLTGVEPRTVRKWMAPDSAANHSKIPYAAWRLLLLELGLVKPTER